MSRESECFESKKKLRSAFENGKRENLHGWFNRSWHISEQDIEDDGAVVRALQARRQAILDSIRDNGETGLNYQKVIFSSPWRSKDFNCCHLLTISIPLNFDFHRKLKKMRCIGVTSRTWLTKPLITTAIKRTCTFSANIGFWLVDSKQFWGSDWHRLFVTIRAYLS